NGQNIPEDEVLITHDLREMGYDCGLVGKLHVSAAQSGTERRVADGYGYYQWSDGCTALHGGDWVDWLRTEHGKRFEEVYDNTSVVKSRKLKDRKYQQSTWSVEKSLDFLNQDHDGPWLLRLNP